MIFPEKIYVCPGIKDDISCQTHTCSTRDVKIPPNYRIARRFGIFPKKTKIWCQHLSREVKAIVYEQYEPEE